MNTPFKKTSSAAFAALLLLSLGAGLAFTARHASAQSDGTTTTTGDCTITNAEFDPASDWSTLMIQDPVTKKQVMGTTGKKFYSGDNPPSVRLIITTQNCRSKKLYISIMKKLVTESAINELDLKSFTVPSNADSFDITMQTGEEGCRWDSSDHTKNLTDKKFDCRYWIHAETSNDHGAYDSKGKPHGEMTYNCDGGYTNTCLDNWAYVSTTGEKPTPNETAVQDGGFTTGIDPNSACGKDLSGKCYALFSGFGDALGEKFKALENVQNIGDFLNTLIAFAIGIAGILAVVMIMYEGFLYIKEKRDGNPEKLAETKSRIVTTTSGLLLLLLIYMILRTINPDLLNLTPQMDNISLSGAVQLTPTQFEHITGEPLGSPSDYDEMAKTAAATYHTEYCALRTIIQRETGGKSGAAGLIGQDENAAKQGIPSRVAFLNSQKKYSGATFTTTDASVIDRKLCNDATAGCSGKVPAPDSPTLGLDWRFSKGIGLAQVTFFPSDYNSFKTPGYVPLWSNRDVVPKKTYAFSDGTMSVTAFEMFKPEKNLEVAAKLWRDGFAKCGTPQGAFYTYACGHCDCPKSPFAQQEVPQRVSLYEQCKTQNP